MLRRLCSCRGKHNLNCWGQFNQKYCAPRKIVAPQAYWRFKLNPSNRSTSHVTLAAGFGSRIAQLQEELDVRPDILQELAQRGFNLDNIRKVVFV